MKENNNNVIALIPAYNPNEKLIELIKELKEKKITIIVVNDGSKDKKIFNKIKDDAHIINHDKNKGKGRALKTGLAYIKEKYDNKYTIVTMDADGQHKVSDALKLIKYSKEHPEVLVLGSRKINKNVPIKSKIGNIITRNVYKLITKNIIYDTQSGLRVFSSSLIDKLLKIKGERYEYEINMLLELSNQIIIKEIEIETIYINNNKESHFNPIIDSYRIYKEIIKYSLVSILSFFLDLLLYCIFLTTFKYSPYYIQISNVIARIFSATFNYSVNKKLDINQYNKLFISAKSYVILAIILLIINTCILTIITFIGINNIIAKIITEIITIIISYIIQHKYIFKEE